MIHRRNFSPHKANMYRVGWSHSHWFPKILKFMPNTSRYRPPMPFVRYRINLFLNGRTQTIRGEQ